jgi:hypothetical protein
VTPTERTTELLDELARRTATSHAIARLLERRPDLAPPSPGLPVVVPRKEDAAFHLDKLAFLAWAVRHLDRWTEVEAYAALHAGASWARLAAATSTSPSQARARYGHLAPRPRGGEPR